MKLSPYRATISVSDLNKISDWYQNVLGFQFSRRIDFDKYGVHIHILELNGFGLELIEKQGAKSKKERMPDLVDSTLLHGLTKIAFFVEDIDVLADDLKEKNVKVVFDITDDPDDKSSWMIIEDPDGNVIQFFAELKPLELDS